MIIEINLLPHREAKRVAELRQTLAVLVLGAVVLGGAVYFVHSDIPYADTASHCSRLPTDCATRTWSCRPAPFAAQARNYVFGVVTNGKVGSGSQATL